jgi:N-acetylglucosaminyl-diphospho-decaprenol L-rhamnosyltransferase
VTVRPDVTAIVVVHDSAHVVRDCLSALAAEGVRAIVVDNASRDDTAAIAEAAGAQVVRNRLNEGFGRAMNIGVAAATTPWCLLTNPDLAYAPGAVGLLMEAAVRWPDAGLLAPRIVEPDGRVFFQGDSLLAPAPRAAPRQPLPEGDCCAGFLSGASLLVRREVFLAMGGFDPAIFLFYEDDDLCRRMREAGRALVHVHEAVARHGRGQSTAPRKGNVFRARWHLAWSKAYVSRKWGLPDPARATFLQNGPKALASAVFAPGRRERYAGSAAGALAWLRGETALGREGLA